MNTKTEHLCFLQGLSRPIGDIPMPKILEDCFYQGSFSQVIGLGGTSNDRWTLGHMRLTYATMCELGILRLPTHPERFALAQTYGEHVPGSFHRVASALEEISAQQWSDLQAAIRDAYNQLQKRLARDYPSGTVRLQRRVWLNASQRYQFRFHRNANGLDEEFATNNNYVWAKEVDEYAALLVVMALKAEQDASDTEFELETDVLTGWCRGDPGAYGEILLIRDTPIQDILFAAPYFNAPRSRGLELDEWLVTNREPTGSMTFDARKCSIPAEVRRAFEERASNTPWHFLRDRTLSGIEDRHRRLRMPSLVPRFQPPWYVRWANAIAQW